MRCRRRNRDHLVDGWTLQVERFYTGRTERKGIEPSCLPQMSVYEKQWPCTTAELLRYSSLLCPLCFLESNHFATKICELIESKQSWNISSIRDVEKLSKAALGPCISNSCQRLTLFARTPSPTLIGAMVPFAILPIIPELSS